MVSKSLECIFLANSLQHQKGDIARLKPGLARFLYKQGAVRIIAANENTQNVFQEVVVYQDDADAKAVQLIAKLVIVSNANANGNLYENITLARIYKEIKYKHQISIGASIRAQVEEKIIRYGVYALSFIYRKQTIHKINLEIVAK